jgi:IMP dehydrogenase
MRFAPEYGELALTFDDVLLAPGYSQVLPAEVNLRARLASDIHLNVPILSAAMDTVTEAPLAIALARLGGVGVIHRNLTAEQQAEEVAQVKEANPDASSVSSIDAHGRLLCAAAIGVGEAALARLDMLVAAGVDAAAIDTAHGHTRSVIDTLRAARRRHPDLPIIAGNVTGGEAAHALIEAGAAAIKVGIGAGSICTTRIVAGVGVPQLSAVAACAAVCRPRGIPLIADGGIKTSGDIVKALAAGADVVMLGSLLAGLDESPGVIVHHDGQRYKVYRGMGSLGAMQGFGADRYGSGAAAGPDRHKVTPEGVEGRVPYRGRLGDVFEQMTGGLRAGMGYVGARDLDELRAKAQFIRITNAGLLESHPHGVLIT